MYSQDCYAYPHKYKPKHFVSVHRSDGTNVKGHVLSFKDGTLNIGPIDVVANETLTIKIDLSF